MSDPSALALADQANAGLLSKKADLSALLDRLEASDYQSQVEQRELALLCMAAYCGLGAALMARGELQEGN